MNQQTCDWLNRIGIVLGFLSFWFAAPEFIGEARLKAWEMSLARGIFRLPRIVTTMWVVLCCAAFLCIFNEHLLHLVWGKPLPGMFSWGGFLFFSQVFASALLPRSFLYKAVQFLANDEEQRQRSLFLGGTLFTISFALQLMATFPKH